MALAGVLDVAVNLVRLSPVDSAKVGGGYRDQWRDSLSDSSDLTRFSLLIQSVKNNLQQSRKWSPHQNECKLSYQIMLRNARFPVYFVFNTLFKKVCLYWKAIWF